MILLDLSDAYYTVDHNILVSRLHNYLGIQDQALKWCKSYLSNRPQYVRIGTVTSHTPLYLITPFRRALCLDHHGVRYIPIPFVILFSAMTLIIMFMLMTRSPIYHLIHSSNMQTLLLIGTIDICINKIRQWIKSNYLKLNDDKTEFLLFGSHQQLSKINTEHINVGDSSFATVSQAWNLGSIFNSSMTMKPHYYLQCHPFFSILTSKHQQYS